MTYFFETYGCQMNVAESAALKAVLAERGWSAAPDGEGADLVLINTCSVRRTAEERALGRLAQLAALKKKRAGEGRFLTVVAAGCMAQRMGEELKARGADYVMGTAARSIFPLILERTEGAAVSGPSPEPLPLSAEDPVFAFSSSHLEEGKLRSFVPIMHGCNNFCSYCIVPYVRGREISRDPAAIMREIRLLGEHGVREITLLGQNVNTYAWEDSGGRLDFPALLRLIAAAVEKTPVKWVRFLSANPKDFSRETIRVMAEHPVFCRHLHLCVQHGSNGILKAMNRRYTREQYLELAAEIREALPGITLSTDILVGFPGETGEDVEQTLDLMNRVRFLYSYMYHYNPREGTAAYDLPNPVDEDLKRRRLGRVIALQKAHTLELLKGRIGSRAAVLIEGISRKNADELIARTERDEMAVFPGKVSRIGSFAEVTLASLRGNTFRGTEILPKEC
jgi:tRNA-2-methylthio-N6-dimethylallyladenosine synthase